MAYLPHHLFVMGGTLGAGQDEDIWQCGFRGSWDGVGTEDEWLAYQAPRISAWYALASSYMRDDSALRYLKMNAIGANGEYVTPNNPHTRNVPQQNGNRGATWPTFLSIATTLRTASTGRLGARGRIYLPNCSPDNAPNSRISVAVQTGIANAVETLIGILQGTDNGDGSKFVPGVYSSKGPAFTITQVQVGNVVDVQRRRKNKLRESYVTVPVIP